MMATQMLGLLAALTTMAAADSLASINHVVLFMQENRAFDHYFGTMAGVRGFADPNVQVDSGKPVFYQTVTSSMPTDTTSLGNWYLNYLGGTWANATQCMVAGSNGWSANQGALDGGLNDNWATSNTPWSWSHFKRQDIPVHFALAEGWTVGDMYQESVIASTNPNRVSWLSGSVAVPGGPQSSSMGGPYIDNNESPGCEKSNQNTSINCYPLKWKTTPEFYEAAGVSWQVYQDTDNFDDNPLAWFGQYQSAASSSSLYQKGLTYKGLDAFYAAARNGTLPEVSIIIGPAELSEHPPYQPKDGAWLQQQVVNAVTQGASYKDTVLIISYDETGGFGDHVTPFTSPAGTAGEWMTDPYSSKGSVPSGPGFRLPFYIISPWTRGGNVYVENADHSSQIMFVEQWQAAKGKNVVTNQIPAWRRQNMADLTKAFDFSKPNTTLPSIPTAPSPVTNTKGQYVGYAQCQQTYPTQRPPVPYKNQTSAVILGTEQGFKAVRGQLTEGRFLTFEMNGYSVQNAGNNMLAASVSDAQHSVKVNRWILHQATVPGNTFQISSAVDGTYMTATGSLGSSSSAGSFQFSDSGNGQGYTLFNTASKTYVSISTGGKLVNSTAAPAQGFALFSVTYNN